MWSLGRVGVIGEVWGGGLVGFGSLGKIWGKVLEVWGGFWQVCGKRLKNGLRAVWVRRGASPKNTAQMYSVS